MKHAVALGMSFLAFAAAPVMAADIPVKARPVVPVVAAGHNWTGCYIGANGGGKWAGTRGDVSVGATTGSVARTVELGRETASTFIVGGQIGCNWQQPGGNWVFGFEGDADWQRWHTSRVLVAGPQVLAPFVAGDVFEVRSNWQASLRGRIGYAWDRWMLYATGGLAITEVRASAFFPVFVGAGVTFPASSGEERKTLLGATVGAGVEYAFTPNWSLGVEGRYSWYGTHTFNTGVVAASAVVGAAAPVFQFAPVTQTVRVDTLEVTGRLNYKF